MPRMNKEEVYRELSEKVERFAKQAAPMYVALNHTWSRLERVPTELEIASTALERIDSLMMHYVEGQMHSSAATGGIEVSYTHWPHGGTDCRIKYIGTQA